MTFWNFVWQISNASVTYTIIGEVSATRLRGKTVSIGMGAYALCIVALTVATPYMLNPTALNWRGKTALFYVYLPSALFGVGSVLWRPKAEPMRNLT